MPLVSTRPRRRGPLSVRGRRRADPRRRGGYRTGRALPRRRRRADTAQRAHRPDLAKLDRKVAELTPWLDRSGADRATFPNFRDGRAYTQARQLRERYGFRGELRATGDILRDQLPLLDPRRLRLARGQEGRRRRGLCRGGRPLQRVLSAERRRLRAGAAPAPASLGRRRRVHRGRIGIMKRTALPPDFRRVGVSAARHAADERCWRYDFCNCDLVKRATYGGLRRSASTAVKTRFFHRRCVGYG